MQPNVIAEAIGHRARFAWLGVLLTATLALLVASPLLRDDWPDRALAGQRAAAAERADLAAWRQHRCHKVRIVDAERRARIEAVRAEHRARREADRAERRARIEADRAERAARIQRIRIETE